MNIFFLHLLPAICAAMHCDKHVVKMIIETAQILSAAHWLSGSKAPYSLTRNNNNKPMNWARASILNYRWLVQLGLYLCQEYTLRYGKVHKTQEILEWLRDNEPKLPVTKELTMFVPAVPEEYIRTNDDDEWDGVIESYRAYYVYDKRYFAKWTKREVPHWYTEGVEALTSDELEATKKKVIEYKKKNAAKLERKKKREREAEEEKAREEEEEEDSDDDGSEKENTKKQKTTKSTTTKTTTKTTKKASSSSSSSKKTTTQSVTTTTTTTTIATSLQMLDDAFRRTTRSGKVFSLTDTPIISKPTKVVMTHKYATRSRVI